MDKKYQDLHIYNYRNHTPHVLREIEIQQIVFTETQIIIDYISTIPLRMVLGKEFISISID